MRNAAEDGLQSERKNVTSSCFRPSTSTFVSLLTSSTALAFDPVTVTSSRIHPCPTDSPKIAGSASRTRATTSSPLTCFTPNCSTSLPSSSFSSRTPKHPCVSLFLPPCNSDDEMSAGSPDSGFESTSPTTASTLVDYYDRFRADDCVDDLSKSSTNSSSSSSSSDRLSLVPHTTDHHPDSLKEKKSHAIVCNWKNCDLDYTFASRDELHLHLISNHVEKATKRHSCLWEKCRVYDKPARNLSWLRRHVSSHTGKKQFKCVIDGCDASFGSQQGLARHVPSHFSEVGLPKARLAACNERRYLVKRRRIKDEKKALANVHDQLDQRSLDLILHSLVQIQHHPPSTSQPPDHQQASLQGWFDLDAQRQLVVAMSRDDDERQSQSDAVLRKADERSTKDKGFTLTSGYLEEYQTENFSF